MIREEGQYNRKRLAALGALILLLILLIFTLWWWFGRRPETPGQNIVIPPQDKVVLPVQTPPQQALEVKPRELRPGEVEVAKLARNFTERYGSFSTDSTFENLNQLIPWTTDRLANEFRKTIATAETPAGFKGTATKALQIDIHTLTSSQAGVTVAAQRIETDAQLQDTVRIERLELTMVKKGDFWLVDQVQWKP